MATPKYTPQSGIYIIKNFANECFYIGQSVDMFVRHLQHWSELRRQVHCNKKLQRDWNKYGEECFWFEVLEYCSIDELNFREQVYLDAYVGIRHCYNKNSKATHGEYGLKRSERTRKNQGIVIP